MKEAIDIHESARRIAFEAKVKNGQKTFIEVGEALLALRDERLYRNDYETFEEYCQEVFGWSSSRARQLVAASQIAKALPGVTIPDEKAAREIGKVPAEKREKVLKASGPTPTAKSIKAAAESILPKAAPTPPEAEQTTAGDLPAPAVDKSAEFASAMGFDSEKTVEFWASKLNALFWDISEDASDEQLARAIRAAKDGKLALEVEQQIRKETKSKAK